MFANAIPFVQMNLKKVQCRWHRFSPATFPQGRLLSSPTLGYQKYKPYRLGPPHILSHTRVNDICTTSLTQTEYVGHAQSIPKRNHPPTRNLPKRNRRGGAYVPARTSAQRRFHTKIHAWCAGFLTMDAPLWGDTGGHTGSAPTHLHHIFPRNPTQTKFRPCAIHPKRNQPSMYNPSLPISIKPCGVPLPHRGYTFDSAGLASATQPTLGNNASEEATPLGVVLFLIAHHYHTRQMISPHEN